jgi:hypothetical protein
LAAEYNISCMPTFMFFKDGKKVTMHSVISVTSWHLSVLSLTSRIRDTYQTSDDRRNASMQHIARPFYILDHIF